MSFDRIKLQHARILAWCSQGINCIFLGGHHDQTLSSRCYVNRDKLLWSIAYKTINFLFRVLLKQDNHCYQSYLKDVEFSKQILSKVI